MANIGTKELLETQSIIDYIDDFQVIKETFTAEDGRAVDYNYFLVTLANGDTFRIKPEKAWKQTIFYALKDGKKSV